VVYEKKIGMEDGVERAATGDRESQGSSGEGAGGMWKTRVKDSQRGLDAIKSLAKEKVRKVT